MIFLKTQSKEQIDEYQNLLKITASLSNLFSENTIPYLYYRIAENAFCRAFTADNLSRSDCSADAKKNNDGIGLKTFHEKNGKTMQKIAEFNKTRNLYKSFLTDKVRLVKEISKSRNKRITSTMAIYSIKNIIYHCVTRKHNELIIYEQSMDLVDIDNIKLDTASSNNVIYFNDNRNEYSFNISKSTLFKRFCTPDKLLTIPVEIVEDPFYLLKSLLSSSDAVYEESVQKASVVLPLYSETSAKYKYVPEKSGLNQWNAGGRARKAREVYIRIPAWIHRSFENFFPDRDTPFKLNLPNSKTIDAKICQGGDKALMSNPNTDLGEWILDEILKVNEEELVTYEMLQEIGIDSVEIVKEEDGLYSIYFKEIGCFDDFEEECIR
ncbi:MAG: NgoFVII family restriction endonuclease [Candidatus Aureabacteria bacterium]|nr:NgoFVII family restriction endonuclease [Candidatus Auribacterota bacterium]